MESEPEKSSLENEPELSQISPSTRTSSLETLPTDEDYRKREDRKNRILYGRDPVMYSSSPIPPSHVTLPELHELESHSITRKQLNVSPEDQFIKGIDIFSIRPGFGSQENYLATGVFEGTKHLSNDCDYAVQKMDSKNDCFVISLAYIKHGVSQLHTFSNKFIRENQITLELINNLLDECYKNLSDKCTYESIDQIGSVSMVFFYRKIKISVGRPCGVNQIIVNQLHGIVNDIFNVIYMAIFNLESKGLLDFWKDPETLEEQMKKTITLEDPNSLLDGIVPIEEEKRKLTWAEWFGFKKKPEVYVPESVTDEYY